MWAGKKRLGMILAIGSLAASSAGVAAQDGSGGAAEAVWVTGNVQPAPSCSAPGSQLDGDVERLRDVECSPQTWTSSEPRLTGEVVRRWNQDIYRTDEGSIEVGTDAAYLGNDGGSWACSNTYVGQDFSEPGFGPATFTCTGDGGYAGLSAILTLEDAGGNVEEFTGLVFTGDFPPPPEAPTVE
jgi:hypothetical protein